MWHELTKRHESFPTKYAVKHYAGVALRIPTSWLTMSTLRHTCIAALPDAGCVREQIRAIAGHTIASINEVLDRYTKLTADQAAMALERRLLHHSQTDDSPFGRSMRKDIEGTKPSSNAVNSLVENFSKKQTIAALKRRQADILGGMVPPVGLEPTLREEPDFERPQLV